MKNKWYFFIFLLLVSLYYNNVIYGQADAKLQTPISTQTKSLHFGNNLLYNNEVNVINSISTNSYKTEYSKYYHHKYQVYDPVKDPKRLLLNTGLFMGAAVASFGILWVLPESFTNWNKEEMLDYGMVNRWKDNVKAGPVWDEDDIFLNWIMHPWAGAVYFMSARGSGYNKWESFAFSAFMSTVLWEYGIEAFAEIPSWQDLLITPILGSFLGEQFFRWKGNIIRNERKVLNSRFLGGTSLFIMDPFNQILDGLGYKTKNKLQTYSAIAPIEYDFTSNKTIWGMQVLIVF